MNARAKTVKPWPHMAVVFLVFALLGGVGAALWMRHEPKAEALAVPHAARVERVEGEVGLSRGLDADAPDEGWVELTPNTPVTVGDRLYARDDSRAALAFTGRNFARLEPRSSLDVLSLSDRRTQLALREGSAVFNIGELAPGELFEVATPYGAVDFREPGFYQMGYNDDGGLFVSVLSGLAQVAGLAGSGQISKGEMLTLLGQTAAQVALSRLSPDYAGGLLDDYYGYQYPDIYDGRYRDYNAYLSDPYYYDPYNRYASYRHVPTAIPGAYDLDYYGDWQNLPGHGYAWSPRVESGWAPYRQGYWMLDDPYGLTWVSDEPWGYAPYHYGRWVSADGRWFWVPDSGDARPAYAPALVAFLPLDGTNQIGWVPLAPGDPYAPAYYDADWRPHYVGGTPSVPERFTNMGVPGALTLVAAEDFSRPVGRENLARYDPRAFDGTRPVLDPLSHAMLRQASLHNAIARRGFVLPPGLAKRLGDRQVYASARLAAPPFRDDLARALRVEAVPDGRKREKLKFKDERLAAVEQAPPVALRGGEDRLQERQLRQQEKALERAARRQESEPRHQSQARAEAERSPRAEQRAQGERVGAARHARAEEERQRAAHAQQQRAAMPRQAEAHRQAQQQAAHQRARQAGTQRAQQHQERMRERQPQQPRPAAQAPPGHGRQQKPQAQQGRGHTPGPPPQSGKAQGGGHPGKGKGRP